MVRVEAPLRAFDTDARPQHGAIEIERDAREPRLPRGVVGQAAEELTHPLSHGGGRLLERAGHRPVTGQLPQPGKAHEDRISLQQREVPQPRAAHEQHSDQRQGDPERAVVAVEAADREDLPEPIRKARAIDEAPEHLEPPVRAQLLLGEDDRKIGLDTAANCAFPYSHECGLFGGGRLVALSSIPPSGPLSIRGFPLTF